MKTKRSQFIIALFLLAMFHPFIQAQSAGKALGEFREAPCPFPLPENVIPGENFRFGYVSVPEFHARPEGKTIELAVAIFPSTSEDHLPDPLVLNTAGPGKSNMDNFIPDIAGGLGDFLLPQRDIVIIELRGLRYSKPFLMVSEVSEARKSIMDKNLSREETMARLREAYRAAKKRFDEAGVNLSAYNNVETAADIAMIMSQLGYEKFNMVGSSAGTMVAHHVIRDYPERVRCAILDAGLPLDPDIMLNYIASIVDCLKNYFEECKNDPACQEAYPDLEERFLALLESLNQNPEMLSLQHPETGEEFAYALNGYRLSASIFLSMFYNTQIPYLIGQILEGDYSQVITGLSQGLVPNYFADGLGHTVFISESMAYSMSDLRSDPKYKIFEDGVSASGMGSEFLHEVDDIWKIDKLDPARFLYPRQLDVPTLVLNGLYDPVIPVKYDASMKKDLKNCYIYRFDGVPHSAFDNATPCALPMLLQFLADPSQAPDSSCMENYKQVYKTASE